MKKKKNRNKNEWHLYNLKQYIITIIELFYSLLLSSIDERTFSSSPSFIGE